MMFNLNQGPATVSRSSKATMTILRSIGLLLVAASFKSSSQIRLNWGSGKLKLLF